MQDLIALLLFPYNILIDISGLTKIAVLEKVHTERKWSQLQLVLKYLAGTCAVD